MGAKDLARLPIWACSSRVIAASLKGTLVMNVHDLSHLSLSDCIFDISMLVYYVEVC